MYWTKLMQLLWVCINIFIGLAVAAICKSFSKILEHAIIPYGRKDKNIEDHHALWNLTIVKFCQRKAKCTYEHII